MTFGGMQCLNIRNLVRRVVKRLVRDVRGNEGEALPSLDRMRERH